MTNLFSKQKSTGFAIFTLLILLLSLPVFVFLNAYTFSTLWFWFVVPLGVPAIGMAHALGLSSIVTFLKVKYKPTEKKETDDEYFKKLWSMMAFYYLAPLFTLFFGYIYHSFM